MEIKMARIEKKELIRRAPKNEYVIELHTSTYNEELDIYVPQLLSSSDYISLDSFIDNLKRKRKTYHNDYFTIETFFYDDNGDLWEIDVYDE